MERLIAYCLAGAFCIGAQAWAGDGDSSDQPVQVQVLGYGSNVQPSTSPQPAQTAGFGGNMQADPSQNHGPVAGFGATNAENPAQAPASGPAAASPKVQPHAPGDDDGVFRSMRYQSGGDQEHWSTTAPQPHAASATLGDVKETLPSLVEAFVDVHGKHGLLALKTGAKGPASALRFESIDHGTEKGLGRGRYSAVAIFRDKNGRSFKALINADCSGSDWKVTRISAVVKRRGQ